MRLLAVLMAVSLVAAACGSTDEAATTTTLASTTLPSVPDDSAARTESFSPGDVVQVDLARTTPSVTQADIAAVVAADSQFGLDLFEVVAADDNLMVSPYSIATALSMLYPGAREKTAEEIADVLHLTVDDATLHDVRNHIETELAKAPPPPTEQDSREPFTIRPANSAWGQGGFPFLEEYLTVLAENYEAGLRLLDYVGDPDGSRGIINEWVEEATEDRIKDLLPDGSISIDTRLVLVNAIWFKANWFEQFNPTLTETGEFELLDGRTVDVPLMHANLRASYAETDLFEAVRLRYAGDASMIVLLPKDGSPANLAAELSEVGLDIPWEGRQVDLRLPSFEFEGDVALKPALQDLGMHTAFVPGTADLSGIAEVGNLYVSDAFHKTFIAVDEDGTEAAAATAFVVNATSSGPPPATFTVDRPFLFWIDHTTTGEMLFLGQVTNPA